MRIVLLLCVLLSASVAVAESSGHRIKLPCAHGQCSTAIQTTHSAIVASSANCDAVVTCRARDVRHPVLHGVLAAVKTSAVVNGKLVRSVSKIFCHFAHKTVVPMSMHLRTAEARIWNNPPRGVCLRRIGICTVW
jgi:hypothetical protein